MEPRELVDQELKLIRHVFEIQKEIYPMTVLIKDDQRYQVPIVFHSSAQKEIIAQGIKDLVKKAEPDVVVYVAEAWVKFIKRKEDRLPLPYTDQGIAEILVAQIEFRTGEKFACEAQIVRKGNHTKLLEFEITDSSATLGRFMDFFPVKKYN